ncbi:MAG: hypothetical protein WBY44_18930 [Bryobacteraceae bacterium]|jgi:hypothetical protein
MIRTLALSVLAAFTVRAQTGITLCPSPLHPDTVQRILTVRGAGFAPTTTAVWQQASTQGTTPTNLAVQFVSATLIKLAIPPTIGTVAGTAGNISVSTGSVIATAQLIFNTGYLSVVCDVQPSEFTAQPNPISFTIYGDQLYSGAFSANGKTMQLTPQPGATVATATVPGPWQAGPLSVQIGSSTGNVAQTSISTLTVNPVPTITGVSASRLYAGQTAAETVSVTGGTPGPNGFAWSLANAPSWISIQSTGPRTASLAVTPPSNTLSAATTAQILVTDGLPGAAVASAPVNVPLVVDAVPALTFSGLPDNNKLQPDQMYMVQFGTNRATPLHLTGQISLGSSTAAFVSGTSAVATVPFDIAPNCVLPTCGATLTLQAGTVSGPVAFAGSVTSVAPQGAGTPPTMAFPAATLQQDPAPPSIDANRISVSQTNGGFTICVPGFTNTLQMNDLTFRLVPASGANLSTSSLSRSVAPDFAAWFTPQNAAAEGGFTLFQPFVVAGSAGAVGQVYVTMSNSAGASAEAGPIDLASAPRCTTQ